nr:hypothetical protein B0A51_01082 [Rachicladosporium sp. CCFEE 5018]
MPAVRTMPSKPVKTERTHEENQERAYIAASRRSDRSLEARIESARRASEIHKRRTGRSLRVTEADVINEEMYEEEDDDLPMQYRRLTAHLQTQNADFDRRLAAYLTNHVAMRSALGQAVSDAWQNNQFNNISQFMNPNMMQMPTQGQIPQQQQHAFNNTPMMPPQPQQQQQQPQQTSRSPTNYRQAPYPVNHGQSMQPGQHSRSASIATPKDHGLHLKLPRSTQSPVDNVKFQDRRASLPLQQATPATPVSYTGPATSSHDGSPVMSRNGSHTNLATAHAFKQRSPQQAPAQQGSASSQQASQATFPSPFNGGGGGFGNGNFDPLSATLPMSTQQLLAGAPSDLNLSSMFMPPQQQQTQYGKPAQQPFYSYNPNGKSKGSSGGTSPSYVNMPQHHMQGMNQTLSMSMLDNNGAFTNSPANDSVMSPFTPAGYGFGGYQDSFTLDPFKETSSGQLTPGEGDWQGLLNDTWDEQTAV